MNTNHSERREFNASHAPVAAALRAARPWRSRGYNLATTLDLDYKTFPARVGSSMGRAAPKAFGVGSELKIFFAAPK
jgi:hypothetical protein